jgi:NAD(P)-dependent dehydrogenase (short-subunit alcohol dehydrogenase family)
LSPSFVKQRFLITGANSDIAVGAARLLIDRGAEVIGLDMVDLENPELFEAFVRLDLSEPGATSALGDQLGDQPLAGLIGVAGARPRPELERERDEYGWLEPQAFATVVADNLLSQYVAFKGSHEALQKGVAQWGQASVTMVGSINAQSGYGDPAYSAGKAGLQGMTVALTKPLGRLGIRVNVVAPGTVDTRASRKNGERLSAEQEDAILESIALGGVAGAGDIASALVSVACDLTHMTGQTLVIDGGQLVAGG